MKIVIMEGNALHVREGCDGPRAGITFIFSTKGGEETQQRLRTITPHFQISRPSLIHSLDGYNFGARNLCKGTLAWGLAQSTITLLLTRLHLARSRTKIDDVPFEIEELRP